MEKEEWTKLLRETKDNGSYLRLKRSIVHYCNSAVGERVRVKTVKRFIECYNKKDVLRWYMDYDNRFF